MAAIAPTAPDSAISTETVFAAFTHYVGRQPIFERSQQVFGYELLFRAGLDNIFSGDPEQATRQMIDNVLLFGLDTLTPSAKAFINCTRAALVDRLVTSLPADVTVLEVHENIAVDDAVFEACSDLRAMGYGIALDDYMPDSDADRLIELADFIKLDCRACSAKDLRAVRKSLGGHTARLIAEKVETPEEFNVAQGEGFDHFQGYFFARPTILQQREIPPQPHALCATAERDQPQSVGPPRGGAAGHGGGLVLLPRSASGQLADAGASRPGDQYPPGVADDRRG